MSPQRPRQIVPPPSRIFLVRCGRGAVIFILPLKLPLGSDACQFHLHFSDQYKSHSHFQLLANREKLGRRRRKKIVNSPSNQHTVLARAGETESHSILVAVQIGTDSLESKLETGVKGLQSSSFSSSGNLLRKQKLRKRL